MALQKAHTKYGIVTGIPGSCGNTIFKGVPFAQPPVGELRLMPPVEPLCWEGELACDHFSAACIQYRRKTSARPGKQAGHAAPPQPTYAQSEDCLYLNIWTPAETAKEKLPVLFWIHGGGFNLGTSFNPEFDGNAFNRQGVILVTTNHRCGPMGYLTHPDLDCRDPRGISGNYGLLDQIAAMKWVQENIAAFGGDPDNVTIFGQSSGGMSTKFHLCTPKSSGLFRRAIIHSGGGLNGGDPTRPVKDLQAITQGAMDILGWTVEDLLTRDANEVTEQIMAAADAYTERKELFIYQPCVDGYLFQDIPEQAIVEGNLNSSEIICGSVLGDSWMFSRRIRSQLEDNPQALRAFAYSPGSSLARHLERIGKPPIHTFFMERDQGEGRGMPHSSDVAYVFGSLDIRQNPNTRTPYDYYMSDTLVQYWANFARTGNPNGKDLPEWPVYTEDAPLTLHCTDEAIVSEIIDSDPVSNRVIEFTIAHPGMLESLEGF